MKALVVYESHWGNTATVARAIAEGIGPDARAVSTREADSAALKDLDLLVVGAPVIGFRLSTPEALKNIQVRPGKVEPPDLSHPPVRNWLEGLPAGAAAAAAFDTRVRGPFGSAAPSIIDGLKKAGYRPVAKPEGFTVKGSQGPLRDGELERALEWGKQLAKAAS